MFNPSRRNRNIGTGKHGHGQRNKFAISHRADGKSYYESLIQYQKKEVLINGHSFLFVVEETREGCLHACSIEDITRIIEHIPCADYGELKFIILRQPKRKEAILSPVWGRLIYSFEFENEYYPAIILEAVDYSKELKWEKSLSVASQKEFERLKKDGHYFVDKGRFFIAEMKPENVRRTQLHRTLLHEFGHYVHYFTVVEQPGNEDEDLMLWEERYKYYNKIPTIEKESLAHQYADKFKGMIII